MVKFIYFSMENSMNCRLSCLNLHFLTNQDMIFMLKPMFLHTFLYLLPFSSVCQLCLINQVNFFKLILVFFRLRVIEQTPCPISFWSVSTKRFINSRFPVSVIKVCDTCLIRSRILSIQDADSCLSAVVLQILGLKPYSFPE